MAKLFVVEDDEDVLETYRLVADLYGHEILLEAASLQEALEKVPQAVELGCTAAVIDGNLTKGTGEDDGQHVAKALREAGDSIFIISCSTGRKRWGDANLEKPYRPVELQQLLAAH